jgi:hypothetical protein
MGIENDLTFKSDFGFENVGAEHDEQNHSQARSDTPSYAPGLAAAGRTHYPEIAAAEAPRQLVPEVHYTWTPEGRLKLIEDIRDHFTVEEIDEQVRALWDRGPTSPPTSSVNENRGVFLYEWRGDEHVMDLHAESRGAPPEMLSRLFSAQASTQEQPAQTTQTPAPAETVTNPSPGSKSRNRDGEDTPRADVNEKIWNMVRNFDWRSPRAWRRRFKRAEYVSYLVIADVLGGGLAEIAPGDDKSIVDKPFPLEAPIAVVHGASKLIGMGKWMWIF